jgi:AraC family L-rhamnose operon transcriptional activator RhaR/AraC family L-rhamnose operon regulatory protein RhaS
MPGFYALFKLEPRMRALHHFKAQLQLSPQALGELSNWLDSLEAEAQYTTPLACSRARAYLQLIVGNLCMQYEALGSLDSTKLLLVVKCIHYMHARLNSAIHLSDLTREAGMSERSLSRNFQATVGQSPIEYLLHLRLQRAEQLLLSSPAPISQVAFEVGFSDANYFTRQFHRMRGQSPREFRKQHRSLQPLTPLSHPE